MGPPEIAPRRTIARGAAPPARARHADATASPWTRASRARCEAAAVLRLQDIARLLQEPGRSALAAAREKTSRRRVAIGPKRRPDPLDPRACMVGQLDARRDSPARIVRTPPAAAARAWLSPDLAAWCSAAASSLRRRRSTKQQHRHAREVARDRAPGSPLPHRQRRTTNPEIATRFDRSMWHERRARGIAWETSGFRRRRHRANHDRCSVRPKADRYVPAQDSYNLRRGSERPRGSANGIVMPCGSTVLIIGAGIAGPALGIALRRVGIESTVYEASDSPATTPASFSMSPRTGFRPARARPRARLAGLGFRNDRLVFHTETGRCWLKPRSAASRSSGVSSSRGLREAALEAGVRVEFGKPPSVGDRARRRGWWRGSPMAGRRGLESRRRRRHSLADAAPAPAPRRRSRPIPGSSTSAGSCGTDLPPDGRAMHMIFGRRGFFGYAVRPDGDTYWFSNFGQRRSRRAGARGGCTGAPIEQRLLRVHGERPTRSHADPAGRGRRSRGLAGVRPPGAACVASRRWSVCSVMRRTPSGRTWGKVRRSRWRTRS